MAGLLAIMLIQGLPLQVLLDDRMQHLTLLNPHPAQVFV